MGLSSRGSSYPLKAQDELFCSVLCLQPAVMLVRVRLQVDVINCAFPEAT